MSAGRPVWVTRASPGAEATAARLTGLGFSPVVAPLLQVRALPTVVELTGIDGLAFTSRNGVEAFGALSSNRTLPVFTVGDATAAAARSIGFTRVRSADGDLAALAALIRAEARGQSLLAPTAADPAGDLAVFVGPAASVRSLPIYETVEIGIAPNDRWDAVLIHSPRAARTLADLAPAAVGRLAVAISALAAEPLAALGFAEVRIADRPTEDALLAALGVDDASALGNSRPGV